MENNNYRSITPLKRKKRKITAPAALILCIIFLVVGILCGKAFSSTNKKLENAQEQIAILKEEADKVAKLEETYKKAINDLKAENAGLKKQISDAETAAGVVEETAEEVQNEEEGSVAVADEETTEAPKKNSGGAFRIIIILVLVAIIVVCILSGVSLFLKKNDDDEDDEEDEEFEEDLEEELEDEEE